jgi:cytochrome c oxidase cbb3-type subunit 2
MKSSAVAFLAVFLALSASWAGFVLAPQLQLGAASQIKLKPTEALYPVARPGLARQGAEVYRSLGCVYCHSQQVGQDGVKLEVFLTDAGTNTAATLAALGQLNAALAKPDTLSALPKSLMTIPSMSAGDPILKAIAAVGAKAAVQVSATGSDIARGWGQRRSVAQDFLYDLPVQLGTRRAGPDLANVGLRQPDVNWHLRHLYAPAAEVKGSTMPPYRFLFRQQPVKPDSGALALTGEFAPPAGFEIVPTDEARALAAYLVSLRAEAPLWESPFTPPPAPAAPATTAPSP